MVNQTKSRFDWPALYVSRESETAVITYNPPCGSTSYTKYKRAFSMPPLWNSTILGQTHREFTQVIAVEMEGLM